MGTRIVGLALCALGLGYGQVAPVELSDSSITTIPAAQSVQSQSSTDSIALYTAKQPNQSQASNSATVRRATLVQDFGLLGGTALGGVVGGVVGGSIGGVNCNSLDGYGCIGYVLVGGFVGYHLGSQLSLHGIARYQKRDIPVWAPLVYSLGHQVLLFSFVSGNAAMTFLALNPLFMFMGAILHERTGLSINPTAYATPSGKFSPGLQISRTF